VQHLGIENDVLKKKIISCEDLIFHYMKDDIDIMTKRSADTM
jgi:hypothetical protein